MIRKALAGGLGAAALVVGFSATTQGCGSDAPAGYTFPVLPDAAPDVPFSTVPTLDGGVTGLLGAGCASAQASAARVPVYMLLVLDGSDSMWHDPPENPNLPPPPSPKWAAVTGALDAVFDDLRDRGDPAFGVGLTIFADRNDPTITDTSAGPYDHMDVPVGFVDAAQHQKLHARVDLTTPFGGTPTFEVLSGQFPLLEKFQAGGALLPGGKRILVLLTDGVPDPDMPAGQNEGPFSLKLAQQEFQKGAPDGPITTFAVGIGQLSPLDPTIYDPKYMGALALAGGAPNLPCDPNETVDAKKMCHFQITPGQKTAAELKQEFIATLNTIRTRALSCEYTLDKSGKPIDPNRVNVIYTPGTGGKTIVPENGQDGWTYDNPNDPSKVILHGATCDRVKADPGGKIDIVLGCETIVK